MVELIVLGSGTGIPSLRRASPGLMVLTNSTMLLIDTGPGTLRKMLEVGKTYRDPDFLLYTHLHPDHTADLIPILFASKYGDSPREKDLLCIGGPGFRTFFKKLEKLYGPWIEPQSYRLTVKEISTQGMHYQNLKISSKPMAHLLGSVGYRMEWEEGKSLAISGDTDYCQSIIDLGFEVDLLILECSFPEGKKVEGHLTPSLAGRIALESHCKKLLLTHLYPICDQFDILNQCKQIYPGPILLAEDLMRISL